MLRKPFTALFAFLLLLFGAAGCHRSTAPRTAAAPPPPAPGAQVGQAPEHTTFHSPSGKTYTATLIAPPDAEEPTAPLPPGAAPSMDNFQGSARASAKLSIATGSPENFRDIGAVLDSLISDGQMRSLGITEDSDRLPQEERVVVVNGFLYAATRESDNDFHCIIGMDPSQPARYMNVEVSGLPKRGADSFSTLNTARAEFKSFFTNNGDALPTRGYLKYNPPVPVQITGSLFYDIDHAPGVIGPQGMRPDTSWEIHPVSDLQFETQQ